MSFDANDFSKKFTSSSSFYLEEKYGQEQEGWMSKIFWGDNLHVLSHLLKDYSGKIDLIYIDPPFGSNADYKKTIKIQGKEKNICFSLKENQYTDKWMNDDEYLQFMYERLILLRELLAKTGCIYLHCDWHKSHYPRLLMDEVFGSWNFINEVIWHYSGAGTPKGCWARRHDNILLYSNADRKRGKSCCFCFNADDIRTDYAITTKKRFSYKINNTRNGVNFGEQSLNPLGKYPEDVLYVPIEAPSSNIRTGYPTQKPEMLLEKLIKASSNPGDLVLDCFMGSGTSLNVAMKLGRRFIGADLNHKAVFTVIKRLLSNTENLQEFQKKYSGFNVYRIKDQADDDVKVKQAEMPFMLDKETVISCEDSKLTIHSFCPSETMRKLSNFGSSVNDWRLLVDSVMIDWNYDGCVFSPSLVDFADKRKTVSGIYNIPNIHSTIKIKIIDIMYESHEIKICR